MKYILFNATCQRVFWPLTVLWLTAPALSSQPWSLADGSTGPRSQSALVSEQGEVLFHTSWASEWPLMTDVTAVRVWIFLGKSSHPKRHDCSYYTFGIIEIRHVNNKFDHTRFLRFWAPIQKGFKYALHAWHHAKRPEVKVDRVRAVKASIQLMKRVEDVEIKKQRRSCIAA